MSSSVYDSLGNVKPKLERVERIKESMCRCNLARTGVH